MVSRFTYFIIGALLIILLGCRCGTILDLNNLFLNTQSDLLASLVNVNSLSLSMMVALQWTVAVGYGSTVVVGGRWSCGLLQWSTVVA